MSLYDRARKDNARILNSDQGFTVSVVFTSPVGNVYPVRGFFIDTNLEINPSTGLPVIARHTAMTVSVYDIDGVLQFITENPADTAGIWKATFTGISGASETFLVSDPMFDRTIGQITMILKTLKTKVIPAPPVTP